MIPRNHSLLCYRLLPHISLFRCTWYIQHVQPSSSGTGIVVDFQKLDLSYVPVLLRIMQKLGEIQSGCFDEHIVHYNNIYYICLFVYIYIFVCVYIYTWWMVAGSCIYKNLNIYYISFSLVIFTFTNRFNVLYLYVSIFTTCSPAPHLKLYTCTLKKSKSRTHKHPATSDFRVF